MGVQVIDLRINRQIIKKVSHTRNRQITCIRNIFLQQVNLLNNQFHTTFFDLLIQSNRNSGHFRTILL